MYGTNINSSQHLYSAQPIFEALHDFHLILSPAVSYTSEWGSALLCFTHSVNAV